MKRITFEVSDAFHKRVKTKALKENTSIRKVAHKLFTYYLNLSKGMKSNANNIKQ